MNSTFVPVRNGEIPFWQVNISPEDRSEDCPDYLRELTDKDKTIIGTRDEDYQDQSWEEVRALVAKKDFAAFKRRPTELRVYRWYTSLLRRDYGSVSNFILSERLHWHGLEAKSRVPFEHDEDYCILYNDCPYGIDRKIVHLVIWMKVPFIDNINGELSDESEQQIEAFVSKTFKSKMINPEHVIWFRNPTSLRSVIALEHLHVMLYNPDEALLNDVCKGRRAHPVQPGKGYLKGFQ